MTHAPDNSARFASAPAAQSEGVEAGRILGFILVLLVLLGASVWASTAWFAAVADEARASVAATAMYPELRQTELSAQRLLGRYEALSGEGVYRIPVERAMEILAEEASSDVRITTEIRLR